MRLKQSLVLTGLKHSGKTTLGNMAARRWNTPFRDLDEWLLNLARKDLIPPPQNCRELYRRNQGQFQKYEALAMTEASMLMEYKPIVLSLGGGAGENSAVTALLREKADQGLLIRIYLMVEEEILYKRILAGGIPPFLEGPDPRQTWRRLYDKRHGLYAAEADIILPLGRANPAESLDMLTDALSGYSPSGALPKG